MCPFIYLVLSSTQKESNKIEFLRFIRDGDGPGNQNSTFVVERITKQNFFIIKSA